MKAFSLARVSLPILLLATLACGCTGDAQASSKGSSGDNWTFLGNSWYVPRGNVEAIFSSTSNGGTFIPITDQTVFYIRTYQGGYFWGRVSTMLTIAGQSSGPNCFQLVGSVTPEGTVDLSFTPTGSSGIPTTGLGTMRFIKNQWSMENQMSTSASAGTITHWAYMVQCSSGQPCMQNLPGTSLTISDMLAPCS
ncbi:MAG: hypothetical protein JO166_16135 [Deltaproteobacteria bacterium]|nr:hypothetical protein [Deltaproteobacteria bacterium]